LPVCSELVTFQVSIRLLCKPTYKNKAKKISNTAYVLLIFKIVSVKLKLRISTEVPIIVLLVDNFL